MESTRLITTCGLSSHKYVRVTISSGENGESEYTPGRSVIMTLLSPLYVPSFFSTVTPGQFPTRWRAPVSALNSVVLPQFGLPASAIRMSISFLSWDVCHLFKLHNVHHVMCSNAL